MGITMQPDPMPCLINLVGNGGSLLNATPQPKKASPNLIVCQHVEHLGRVVWVGPIIKRQRNHTFVVTT